jgi:hypothetical protein
MYDKGMHGMFGMYDFAAAGSGRDRVRRDRRFPPHGRTGLPIHTIHSRHTHLANDPCHHMFANLS